MQSYIVQNIAFLYETSEDFSFSITSIIDFLIPTVPKFTSLTIAALLSLAPVIWIQLRSKKNTLIENILIFGLYVLVILLISPKSETHHLINLFPALSIIFVAMLFQSKTEWRVGLLVIRITCISVIIARFHNVINIIDIFTIYISNLWLHFRDSSRTVVFNRQNTDYSLG